MMAHTPGPWSVTDNSWEVSSVYGPDGDVVAECPIDGRCCEDTQGDFEPIKEANARLIATAPELLEAVEEEIASLENDIRWADGSELERLINRRNRLEALIAKATGVSR